MDNDYQFISPLLLIIVVCSFYLYFGINQFELYSAERAFMKLECYSVLAIRLIVALHCFTTKSIVLTILFLYVHVFSLSFSRISG